jgi:arginyl-tRNA synthetase
MAATAPSPNAVARLAADLGRVADAEVVLERPSDPAHGDYATNVALRLAGARRRAPREIAQEIADAALGLAAVERAEVAGPGFVNLWLAPSWYADALAEIVDAGRDYGAGSAQTRERVQVEMVSANPTGPINVGSARNGAYGDAVARLLEFAGHAVEREYYYNDAGLQMERFRNSVEARRRGEEPPEDGYHGAYVEELARLGGDPVPVMLERIERTLERFRIHFDTWARETSFQDAIPAALEKLDVYEAEDARWLRTSAYGDDKDRVIVRSDGSPTYLAGDAAYMEDKFARGFERLIYVLGADHHGYMARLKALAASLGHDAGRVEILLYQLVHLTRGGEATKMSKRRGDNVFLDELIDEIGVDATRYFMLQRSQDSTVDLDLDLAREQSAENPVYYIQYAHARIASVFRKAGAERVAAARSAGAGDPGPLHESERALVKKVLQFADEVAEAADRRAPHRIAAYALELAQAFTAFYRDCLVVGAQPRALEDFRLRLCDASQATIARSLALLGVTAPDEM